MTNKLRFALSLFALMLSLSINATIISGSCGDNATYRLEEDGTLYIEGSGKMTDYIHVSSPWSSSRSQIVKVQISDGITSIGESAFEDCYVLTSVTIPTSVTSIGNYAFRYCSSLTSVNIPNSVTSIGEHAFDSCDGMTSMTIPNSVTSIEEEAFKDCSSLTSVIIPNSVTSIGSSAFSGCSSLTSVAIPNSVTSIGNYAFEGCSNLKSVDIPNSVTSIGSSAFYKCSGLTSITIPNSITRIEAYTFYGCSGLTSITIPSSVKSIGEKAFELVGFDGRCSLSYVNITDIAAWCEIDFEGGSHFSDYYVTSANPLMYANHIFLNGEEIKDLVIPNTVTTIKSGAFCCCSGFTSVTIPNSVTTIENSAFLGCTGITSLTIPNSVTYIGDFAFADCSLKSVTIGSSLNEIGECTFAAIYHGGNNLEELVYADGCTRVINVCWCYGETYEQLKSITIPSTVTSIESAALFSEQMVDVNISDVAAWCGVKIEDNGPFYRGQRLLLNGEEIKDLIIPNTVTSIEAWTFSCCSGLTSVTIPKSVTSISDRAFYDCSNLSMINVESDNENYCSIDGVLFNKDKTHLIQYPESKKDSNYTIPNSVTSIDDDAFHHCSSLTSVTIPNSVTSIGNYAFSGCSGLTSVTIPNSLTSIGNYAFYGCSSLTSITIPNSVTSIGQSAFKDCSGLTSVNIPNSVTCISESAFWGCSGLTSVTIPNSVTSIGSFAFWGCSGLTSIISEIHQPFPIPWNVFSDVSYNQATLYAPPYSLHLYQTMDVWQKFNNIVPFDDRKNIVLSVNDDRNQDITNQVSVLWSDTNAKQIGSGNSLNGIEEGDTVYYSVQFNEDLGRKYKEVIMQQVVVDSDTETLTCTLEEIPRIELAGRVVATDIDKTAVTVTVRQMLNGKYEQTYTTQTDEQGQFKIEVYDDVTDISFTGNTYFDTSLHRDCFSGNANMGVIPMNLLSGFAIAADVTLKKATEDGATIDVFEWTGGLNNIEFSLYNATKSKELSDFTVQNGKLIIKSGASIGDEITLMAKSKQNIFAIASTTFFIAEGTNRFWLELTELGGIDVTYAASSNGKTIGYLYDANNTLVAKGSYVGDALALRHLLCGNYTLVTMGNSALLGNLTKLSDLNSIGLTEGSDFITTSIAVTDGVLSASSISEVPRMDDTRFYYTSDNAYFSANKASVTVGNYIALSANIDLKPQYQGKVDDVQVTVELPEGCQLVENSVIANRQAVAHTYNGNKLMMNLSKDQWQGEIRFCVIPVLNQTYAITAMASFDIDGGVSQPIGTAQFESKGLSLNTLSQTADSNITINGTAKGKSDVSIYDNDVLIGKTTSKADGTWTATCELYKTFSHSFHNIYAKITDENGLELTSETKLVEYDNNYIVPKSVTMTFYNGWYKENKTVKFNLIDGTTTSNSYPFYSAADFTFLADFTKNDSTLIKNVNIKVLNSDGTVRTLPAVFDEKQGKWVATTKYSSSKRLPQNVTVEYDYIPQEVPIDPSIIEEDNNQFKNLIKNYVMNADSTKCEVLEATDSKVVCKYQTYTMDLPVIIQLEKLNYDELIKEFEIKEHFSVDNDGVTINVVDSLLDEKNMQWIWIDAERSMVYIEVSAVNTNAMSRPRKAPNIFEGNRTIGNLLANSVLNMFLPIGDIMNNINDFNTGHKDLQNWLEKYNQTLKDQMLLYNRTLQLLEAKCPDGSSRLSDSAYSSSMTSLKNCFNDAASMRQQFNSKLNLVERDIRRKRNFASGLSACGALVGIVPSINTTIQGIGGVLRYGLENLISGLGTATASDAYGHLIENTFNTFYTTDDLSEWYFPASRNILNKYINLQTSIQKSYKKCEKGKEEKEEKEEQDDEPLDEKSDNKPGFPGSGSKAIIDPSGYVYEAVLSNRIEGVTATCYQKVQTEDMYGDITDEAVIWNAEDYSQQNPVKTDKNGFYRWDVPQGMWQVKYEKEGYETVYSGWLPVPPPQLDVNIAMKQSTPPTVKQMRGTESGITIDLTKYMLPTTMNTTNITVNRNGKDEQGIIEMLNAEQAPLSGETYVQKVKFIPNTRFNVTDDVVVTVHKEVESYCGVSMADDYQETVTIESEITDIVVDEEISVPYQGSKEVTMLVLPRQAAAGRKLLVKTSSEMIASVSANSFDIDENGTVTLSMNGELPGGAVIDFEIEGTDVTATSKVQVKKVDDYVASPTSSIRSGEIVTKGTMIELSCETEGITIYYTLDGSCPCSETNRIVYTGPIAINETVTVKAMTVGLDMTESDVAEFIYFVEEVTEEVYSVTVEAENGSISISPESENGIYKIGDLITITATPSEGYSFLRWSDGNTDNPYCTAVSGDLYLTAIFEKPDAIEMIISSGTSINIFTVQGVCMKRNATATELRSLPSGMYIVNGRKIMVK